MNLYEIERKGTHIVMNAAGINSWTFLPCAICEDEEAAKEEMRKRIKEEYDSSRKYMRLEIKSVYDEEYSDEISAIEEKIAAKLKKKREIESEIEYLNETLDEAKRATKQ